MHQNHKITLWVLGLVAIFSSIAQAVPEVSLATEIANHYTKSFPERTISQEKPDNDKQAHEAAPAQLGQRTRREVIFNRVFTKSENYALLEEKMQPILNKYAWPDLKLFYGTSTAPDYHLMGRINKTHTLLGEGALATMLVTPTSSIAELSKRQSMIQAFLEAPEALAQLRESLHTYQEAEEGLYSLWTPNDPLYTSEYQRYMNANFYVKDNPEANFLASRLEFEKRCFRDFWDIAFAPLLIYAYLPASAQYTQSFGTKEEVDALDIGHANPWIAYFPYYSVYRAWQQSEATTLMGRVPDIVFPGLMTGLFTRYSYKSAKKYQEYSSVLRNLALRMADVQAFVVAATEVSDCIAASPALEAAYGDRLTKLRLLLAESEQDTELGRLVYYLKTLPYNSWSYFFNNAGRLLASHKLFTEHKDAFADALYALGEVDAFASIATLVEESRANGAPHAYTFTKFLSRQQKGKPYVKLDDMWNPFLDAKEAVGNTVEMDAEKGIRNIILTGPNAGGKSTFVTGVTTSVLLSQTFGIAPAKEAVLTPFDKINTYIDIADDIAAGKSLFMAEVDRAHGHLKMLSKLKKNEFSFSIFDEPFSGTNPTEGAAAEYSILESMAYYTNTMNIVATHYPIVMLLEQNAPDKGFRNYKVYITHKQGAKKIGYTYKVIPGKSTQAIAIDILEEQGYNTSFLKRAREIIAHPERYPAKF